ncbi:MAG TPA: ABC transporter permease, partial [Streptosporangiaceae bacterium]
LMSVLVFVSSAYVPVSSMPGWLQPVAEQQPVTPMVDAVRGLAGGPRVEALLGHTTAYYVGLSLIWAAAIVVVFGVVAAVRFSRR